MILVLIVQHEDYSTRIPGSPFDIALVKFDEPITYNEAISPVCLPSSLNQEFTKDDECWITGWGLTQGLLCLVL